MKNLREEISDIVTSVESTRATIDAILALIKKHEREQLENFVTFVCNHYIYTEEYLPQARQEFIRANLKDPNGPKEVEK